VKNYNKNLIGTAYLILALAGAATPGVIWGVEANQTEGSLKGSPNGSMDLTNSNQSEDTEKAKYWLYRKVGNWKKPTVSILANWIEKKSGDKISLEELGPFADKKLLEILSDEKLVRTKNFAKIVEKHSDKMQVFDILNNGNNKDARDYGLSILLYIEGFGPSASVAKKHRLLKIFKEQVYPEQVVREAAEIKQKRDDEKAKRELGRPENIKARDDVKAQLEVLQADLKDRLNYDRRDELRETMIRAKNEVRLWQDAYYGDNYRKFAKTDEQDLEKTNTDIKKNQHTLRMLHSKNERRLGQLAPLTAALEKNAAEALQIQQEKDGAMPDLKPMRQDKEDLAKKESRLKQLKEGIEVPKAMVAEAEQMLEKYEANEKKNPGFTTNVPPEYIVPWRWSEPYKTYATNFVRMTEEQKKWYQKHIDDINKETSELEKEIPLLQARVQEQEPRVTELEEVDKRYEASLLGLKQAKEKIDREVIALNQEKASDEDEIQNVQNQLEKNNAEAARLNVSLQPSREARAKAQKDLSDATKRREDFDKLITPEAIAALRKEVDALKAEYARLDDIEHEFHKKCWRAEEKAARYEKIENDFVEERRKEIDNAMALLDEELIEEQQKNAPLLKQKEALEQEYKGALDYLRAIVKKPF
jgi:hypothetical protein